MIPSIQTSSSNALLRPMLTHKTHNYADYVDPHVLLAMSIRRITDPLSLKTQFETTRCFNKIVLLHTQPTHLSRLILVDS